MLGKILKAMAEGTKALIESIDDKSNIGGYLGTANTVPCGVCGMDIPRGAQVCPFCQRQPDCRNTGRGNPN